MNNRKRTTYEVILTTNEVLSLIRNGKIKTVLGENSDIEIGLVGVEEKTDFTEPY